MPASMTRQQILVTQPGECAILARELVTCGGFFVYQPLGSEPDRWTLHTFTGEKSDYNNAPADYYYKINSYDVHTVSGMYVNAVQNASQVALEGPWSAYLAPTYPRPVWYCNASASKRLRLTCPAGTTRVYMVAPLSASLGIAAVTTTKGTLLYSRINFKTTTQDGVVPFSQWTAVSLSLIANMDFPSQWVRIAEGDLGGAVITFTTESTAEVDINGFLLVGGTGENNPYDGVIDPDTLSTIVPLGDTDDNYLMRFQVGSGGTPFLSGDGHMGSITAFTGVTETYSDADGTAVVFGGGSVTVASVTTGAVNTTLTTAAEHGVRTGQTVVIASAAGTGWTAINGTWIATRVDSTNFTIVKNTSALDAGNYTGGSGKATAYGLKIATASFTMTRSCGRQITSAGHAYAVSTLVRSLTFTPAGEITEMFTETFLDTAHNDGANVLDLRLYDGLLAGGSSFDGTKFAMCRVKPYDAGWSAVTPTDNWTTGFYPDGQMCLRSSTGVVVAVSCWSDVDPTDECCYIHYTGSGSTVELYRQLRTRDTLVDLASGVVIRGGHRKLFTTFAQFEGRPAPVIA